MFTKILGTLGILAMGIFLGFNTYTLNPKSENVETFIQEFCQLLEKNDRKEIASKISDVPVIYQNLYKEAVRETLKDESKENKSSPTAATVKLFKDSSDFSTKDKMIDYVVPALDLIRQQDRKFTKIIEVKEHNNEAKAIVSFGNENLADINFEMLIYDDGTGWKVFSFTYPEPFAKKYAEPR